MRARHHRSPSRSEVRRPGLHPPWPAERINNNLLLWSSVSDPSRDRVDSFSSTLRRRRDMGELDGWASAAFLRMASLRCEAKGPNKDERPCQLFRCNTGHRMSAHASFFGATLVTHPALPRRGWFLAIMSDPRINSGEQSKSVLKANSNQGSLGIRGVGSARIAGREPSSGYEYQSVSCQTAGRLQTMRPVQA